MILVKFILNYFLGDLHIFIEITLMILVGFIYKAFSKIL